jgi:hypothetical protein
MMLFKKRPQTSPKVSKTISFLIGQKVGFREDRQWLKNAHKKPHLSKIDLINQMNTFPIIAAKKVITPIKNYGVKNSTLVLALVFSLRTTNTFSS